MLDVETLDTRPSTVILSIGAVRFDIEKPDVIGDTFHVHIDIDSCLAAGRTVSGSTILWWLGQSDEARRKLTQAERVPLHRALMQLTAFLSEKDRVWGNGAAFDNAILADAYRCTGLPQPWRFWGDMCYRTLKNLHKDVKKPTFEGIKHDALADAANQAVHLQLIYERIRSGSQVAA
jgi:hypothetical protein